MQWNRQCSAELKQEKERQQAASQDGKCDFNHAPRHTCCCSFFSPMQRCSPAADDEPAITNVGQRRRSLFAILAGFLKVMQQPGFSASTIPPRSLSASRCSLLLFLAVAPDPPTSAIAAFA